MAQKSIKSFFTVQKKKVEEIVENVSEDKTKTPEKKCNLTNGKSPIGKGTGDKNEVDSPIVSGKRKSRKLVLSSDEEEENMSPKSSAGSSKSVSPEDKKPVRKKQIKGAAALKEIEAKRAAKKARLELSSSEIEKSDEVIPEVKENDKTEDMETDAPASPSKEKSTSPSKAESPVKEKSPAKEESPIKEMSPVKKESPTKEKSPAKKPSSQVKDKSPEKEAIVTSDFSDNEDKPEKESPPAKKGKNAGKTATKKKSPAKSKKPAAKKTPVADKKPAEKKASSAFSSFFAPKGGKKEEAGDKKEEGETLGIAKEVETCGYNPAKSKYHPIDDASWERGKPVPYLALARTLECIEETSARLKIADILSNFLRSVMVLSPDNLIPSIYLCLNKLAPAFEGLELGLAERSLMKAVAQSSGRSEKQTMEELEETGDLGIVAQNSCGKQRKLFHPPPLTVPKVFNQLKDLAAMKGKDAMSRKQDKIVAMYNACKPIEARYLIRSLNGKLRIGLAEQTVLQAIALACVNTPPGQEYPPPIIEVSKKMSTEAFQEKLKEQALILKTTYCECPIYDKIIPVLLEHGIEGLPEHCQISPGVPLRPMLAHPTKGVADVLARFDGRKFTCEWKYDGERAQIHFNATQKTVRIFSRNQEDNTSKFPEVVSRLSSQLSEDVTECILDCEAVGWDRENSRILPFQVLSTRKKKDATEADIKVQVCLFVFDLLYVNGEPLVKVPLEERRKKLREVVKEVPGQMQFADFLDTDNVDEVQEYLDQSIKGNCEGLMVKTLQQEATYEIAKRSRNWLKLKKDYLEGVGDTLDLVVIGGYLGRGKRAGVYGGFLLACYDPETEQYQSICKIGTGFSDESLQQHSEFFKAHILPGGARSYYHCDPSLNPDQWFDAVQVWEVKCADLSLSPVYKAALGIVDSEKGISLRFPRFLRIRDDKKVEEATSAAQVAELYQSQEQVKNQSDGKAFNEEDFY